MLEVARKRPTELHVRGSKKEVDDVQLILRHIQGTYSADVIKKEIAEYLGEPTWVSVLKTYRRRLGLTQAELGRKMGVSRQYISRLETGKRALGKRQAKEIALHLAIPKYTMLLEE